MNRVDDLNKLHRSARRQLARIRLQLREVLLTPQATALRRHHVPVLVIDGINVWSNFVRAFYISSALGGHLRGGKRVQANALPLGSVRDTLFEAVKVKAAHNLRKIVPGASIDRRWEPAWHDPNTLLVCSQHVGLSNCIDIVQAFSPFPSFVSDWSCARNFFAHRNGATYDAARNVLLPYGVVTGDSVADWVLHPEIRTARPLLDSWCVDLDILCEYLCG